MNQYFIFSSETGLDIARHTELCRQHMGKYPVISISLKDAEGGDFQTAYGSLGMVISEEAERYSFLMESDKLVRSEKAKFQRLMDGDFDRKEFLAGSLKLMTRVLCKHYGRPVIVLLDEYDVPLDKAYRNHYYAQMIQVIRSLFSQTFKTNRYAEYFGFTDDEVRRMLEYYGVDDRYKDMKEWYHGMLLGLLKAEGSWVAKSNAESGLGYTDIKLTIPSRKTGCVIEVKYAEKGAYDFACREAMRQIENERYADVLKQEGIQTIHKYGIACFGKACKVAYSEEVV